MMPPRQRCAWCAGPVDRTEGVYLALLYPDRHICRPCGQLTINCTCPRPAPITESEERAMDGNR